MGLTLEGEDGPQTRLNDGLTPKRLLSGPVENQPARAFRATLIFELTYQDGFVRHPQQDDWQDSVVQATSGKCCYSLFTTLSVSDECTQEVTRGMTAMVLDGILPAERAVRSGPPHPLGNDGSWRVYPRTEQEIRDLLTHADREGLQVTVSGGGTKRGFGGQRKRYDLEISLAEYKGVIEHRAGDLTMTVHAGTPIRELAEVLAAHGQMLPADPRWPGSATIGGVIAANDTGPKRLAYGAPRDFVIGVRAATPDGRILRTGGKVVKNVAGYDMNKLWIGSMGTLGILLEVTVKLRPLPPDRGLLLIGFPAGAQGEIQTYVNRLQASSLEPVALEVLNPSLSARMAGWERDTLAIAFEDRPEAVTYQLERAEAERSGMTESVVMRGREAEDWWMRFAEITPDATASIDPERPLISAKVALKNTDVAAFVGKATEQAVQRKLEAFVHGGAGHGISRVYVRGEQEPVLHYLQVLRTFVEKRRGSLISDQMPLSWRKHFDVWGYQRIPRSLMEGIKQSFDPNRTLNHQRYAGGI